MDPLPFHLVSPRFDPDASQMKVIHITLKLTFSGMSVHKYGITNYEALSNNSGTW
jgi:hypothetical protein